MKALHRQKNNILIFSLGVFSVLTVLLFTGVSSQSPVGKYEMEVISTTGRTSQIYVLDTTTGQVKWVDSLNTPFVQMKGE